MPIARAYLLILLKDNTDSFVWGLEMRKRYFALLLALLLILIRCALLQIQESMNCSICDQNSYHAPCIINTQTGELLELRVYDPHPAKCGELAEIQRVGYFCLIQGAGV